MEKKDALRFTLRFDGTDAGQRKTAEILGKLGRRKARYVAQAVCFYEHYRDGGGGSVPPAIPRGPEPEMAVTGHTHKMTGAGTAAKGNREAMGSLDQADIRAIKSGMDAFRRKKG